MSDPTIHHSKCECAVETRCRLCDAAPELLDALKLIESKSTMSDVGEEVILAAKAAIAKAEGKA